MIKWFAPAALLLTSVGATNAHRLDEYLQAVLITVERNRIDLQVRLTPGVAVLPSVLAGIDSNADGVIAESEQQAYTARVLGDLSVTVDDVSLKPRVVSTSFPAPWLRLAYITNAKFAERRKSDAAVATLRGIPCPPHSGSSVMAGTYLARLIVEGLSVTAFQYMLDIVMVISGLALLWQTLR